MISLSENEENPEFKIPPKLKLAYTDFKLIQQAATYRLFEAKLRNSDIIHTIRVLDPTTEFVSANYDLAATLFIQELLRLQSIHPEAVLINSFEMSSNDRLMAYASLPYYPLDLQSDQNQQNLIPKDLNTMVNLIKQVVSDVEFLWRDIQFRDFMKLLGSESIYFMKDQGAFFLGNWAKYCEGESGQSLDSTMISSAIYEIKKELTSQTLAKEIKEVAFAALKSQGIDYSDLERLYGIPRATMVL